MNLSRRSFVTGASTGLVLPGWARAAGLSPPPYLPSPDLGDGQFRNIQVWSGIRPCRAKNIALAKDDSGAKWIVHNYGHGGGGITLSWGCAKRVLEILGSNPAVLPSRDVAVLGSGVIGLTTATILAENGFNVTVYTKDAWQTTTSAVAGGQFAPSLVEFSDRAEAQKLVNAAYDEHVRRGAAYGVAPRDNYAHRKVDDLDMAAEAVGSRAEAFDRLPFRHMNSEGWKYSTLLVNPRRLLPKLEGDLAKSGVPFVRGPLDRGAVDQLPQKIVVNCTGLGSSQIWPDPDLSGVKGLLAVLPRQPSLKYLYSGIGYLFPRSDHLIIGGSIENVTATGPATGDAPLADIDKARFFLKVMRAVFAGAIPVPKWYSGGSKITGAMMIGRDSDLDDVPDVPPQQ